MRIKEKLRLEVLIVSLSLFIIIFAVYWQVMDYEFINFDDDVYVSGNERVLKGLNVENISWAFSFDKRGTYWHPLTWLSHMLDCQFFGLDSGLHHLTNLLFHIANTLLLFFVLSRMTGALWKSAFVAALFALHPINVDSVAWIAERKNLLSTFFWMLTMMAYINYAARPAVLRYLLTMLFFIMGLLAKPMLVTLPFVFILMDWWPLGRLRLGGKKASGTEDSPFVEHGISRLIFEKLPLLVLSIFSIVISSLSLQKTQAIVSVENVPMGLRIANAMVSYVKYLGKMVWPNDLAVYYPYPSKMFPLWQLTGAVFFLALISVFALYQWRRRSYFTIGWFWYLGTFVPVVGIIQGGLWPSMADRWAYVPFIGIYTIVSWGIYDLLRQLKYRLAVLTVGATLILSFFAFLTWNQAGYWKNSLTLFEHSIAVTKKNFIAENNLGLALEKHGKLAEAIDHYNEALRIKPERAEILGNLGVAYAKIGKLDKSVEYLASSLQKNPNDIKTYINLGITYAKIGKYNEALDVFHEALEIDPLSADVFYNMGILHAQTGRYRSAIECYEKELQINPRYLGARINLANNLVRISKIDDAISHYSEVLKVQSNDLKIKHNIKQLELTREQLDNTIVQLIKNLKDHPQNPTLLYKLGAVYQKRGYFNKALISYKNALSYDPEIIHVYQNMAAIYSIVEDYENALSTLKKILELAPDNSNAYYNIACIYSKQNMVDESIEWLRMAIEKGFDNWKLIMTDNDLETIRGTSDYRKLLIRHKGKE